MRQRDCSQPRHNSITLPSPPPRVGSERSAEGACIKAVKARIERSRRAQQAHRKEARTRVA